MPPRAAEPAGRLFELRWRRDAWIDAVTRRVKICAVDGLAAIPWKLYADYHRRDDSSPGEATSRSVGKGGSDVRTRGCAASCGSGVYTGLVFYRRCHLSIWRACARIKGSGRIAAVFFARVLFNNACFPLAKLTAVSNENSG